MVVTFLHELPANAATKICDMIERTDCWQLIASHFRMKREDIETITLRSRTHSPVQALWNKLSLRNTTVVELLCFFASASQTMPSLKQIETYLGSFVKAKVQTSSALPSSSLLKPSVNLVADPLEISEDSVSKENFQEFHKWKKTFKKSIQLSIDADLLPRLNRTPEVQMVQVQESEANLPVLPGLSGSRVPDAISMNKVKNIKFSELAEACFYFDKNIPGILLGHGGFGEVFRGSLEGKDIAVKRILEDKRFNVTSDVYQRCISQALTELKTLHSYPAENILPLLAVSFENTPGCDPCLVYEYMPNGSVLDRLLRRNGTPPLNWEQRKNIALGTGKGLKHLHANNIIHGDIKSGNILLDADFNPKIGDFGMARGGPENSNESFLIVSIIQGTRAYLPDDYIRSHQLTPAVDTFCFGMFMFELITARSPSAKIRTGETMRELMLKSSSPELMLDPNVAPSDWSNILFFIGKDCTKKLRKQRPSMEAVTDALENLAKLPPSTIAMQRYFQS